MKYSNKKLRGKIREKFGTEKEFAKHLNITSTTVSLKLNGKGDWTRSEMEKIVNVLSVKREEIMKYFFEISND